MNFRSFNDLNLIIVKNLDKLPLRPDLIVGIPRSGLLPANLLSLYLNIPFTDVEGFLENRILSNGSRNKFDVDKIKNVMIIDDSIEQGNAMSKIKKMTADIKNDYNICYGAVFAHETSKNKVDFYFDVCPLPRLFEWNIFHLPILEKSCIDIDGVLCRDPNENENDDGPNYKLFLENVTPLILPSVKVGYFVTNRLEKYREQTEKWLKKYNLKYKGLIMQAFNTKEERIQANNYGAFKAKALLDTNSIFFIESSEKQSYEIAKITGRSVYCFDTRSMINPDFFYKNKGRLMRRIKNLLNKY